MLRFLSIVWFLSSNFGDRIDNTSLIKTKHIQPQSMEDFDLSHIKMKFQFPKRLFKPHNLSNVCIHYNEMCNISICIAI